MTINPKLAARRQFIVGFALTALAIAVPSKAVALPVEGAPIIVATDGDVMAQYLGTTTAFNSDLYLVSPAGAYVPVIFNNYDSPIGLLVDLGSFTAGTELIFKLHVNTTGDDFYSGDPSRNPDNKAHARVDDAFSVVQTLVEFEDQLGAPEGSQGFNDLKFAFSNVRSTLPQLPPPIGVPDGGSTMALLGLSVTALFGFFRRMNRQ